MKFLFDLLPVGLFFVAIFLWDIFVATAVAIAATVAQVTWLKLRKKKVESVAAEGDAVICVAPGADSTQSG